MFCISLIWGWYGCRSIIAAACFPDVSLHTHNNVIYLLNKPRKCALTLDSRQVIVWLYWKWKHNGLIINSITWYESHVIVKWMELIFWMTPINPQWQNSVGHCVDLLMMTSSNGNIFRVTGHLCGEFTGPRWIPRTKVSDAELWCFLWYASE